jgi:hypothetical protein
VGGNSGISAVADNEAMNEKIKEFANKYWNLAANHKKGERIPWDTISIVFCSFCRSPQAN